MVVDPARLPVVSAERRESDHVGELPKKRATRKVGAESANVFAVRVRNSGFGITDYLPKVVDLAPVHPTVRSSQRADVDFESVEVNHIASDERVRGQEISLTRCKAPVHDISPALIIDGHDHRKSMIRLSAQIDNLVALLSKCIAATTQNKHRGARYPEITQLPEHVHISPLPPVKFRFRGFELPMRCSSLVRPFLAP